MSAQESLPRSRGPSTPQSSWKQNLHSGQAMSLSLTPFFSSPLPSSQRPLPPSPASADSLGRPLIAVLSENPRRASMQGRSLRASPAVLPLPPWIRFLSELLHSTLSHLTRLSYEQISHDCKELSQLAPSTSSCRGPPSSGNPGPAHFFQGHSWGTPREVR